MLRVGSLYAGVGGLCLGLKNAGFTIEWANEYDKFACQTYRENFSHQLYEGDVWKLEPSELPKIDLLAGGFPCQPFSIAGYRKGFEDDRGNHFFRMIEYIEYHEPKVVFFENVKNLVSHDNGNTIKVITKTLSQFGYDFHLKVLNTKEHGNIPQNRERIFIIGFKKDENDYSKYFRFPQPIKLNKSVTDLLETDVDEKYFYPKSWYGYDMLEEMMKSKKTIYQWRRHYVRENKNNVCPTLTANMGTGGHNVPLVLTDAGIRKLTPRECFRFQGFPDSYILPETVKNASLYKQAGNSVSVSVIERIGNNIQKALNKEFCDDENPDLFTG